MSRVRPEFRTELVERRIGDPVLGAPACAVAGCDRAGHIRSLCRSHHHRWMVEGKPELVEYVRTTSPLTLSAERNPGPQVLPPFDFRPVRGQLRLEWQYLLQCRYDEQRSRIEEDYFNRAVSFLGRSGVGSTLDRTTEQWVDEFYADTGWVTRRRYVEALWLSADRYLGDLLELGGWDGEYPKDVWELRRLGFNTMGRRLRFAGIPQQWLKELAKRYIKYRLSTGISLTQVYLDLKAIESLAQAGVIDGRVTGTGPSDLNRAWVERWVAIRRLNQPAKRATTDMSSVAMFLRTVGRFEWAPDLPRSAEVYSEDYPKTIKYAPRFLSDVVMAQIEDPANLAQFHDDESRLITLLLIRAGIRIGSALTLALDCLVYDGEAPYLRYLNHKMQREAFVPIGPETADLIKVQQQAVMARFPHGRPCLFPSSRSNPDGSRSVTHEKYRRLLKAWLLQIDVRDDTGRPLRMTPHQWRHTFATRLTDRNCPQEVIQRLLDHSSPAMVAIYAHLKDKKVRQEWEKATKVNSDGEVVTLDPAHPLNEAIWTNSRLGRATMALPNGYCGLPLTQNCETANQCLTCPMFLTTKDFLPQHRRQRSETARLIAVAEANGQFRMVQTNTTVLHKLDRIIDQLTEGDP